MLNVKGNTKWEIYKVKIQLKNSTINYLIISLIWTQESEIAF